MTDFTLSEEDRKDLLESHGHLRTILQTIWECNDLWMSDVGKLESLMFKMQRHLNFERKKDAEGSGYYDSFVLAEENNPAPKKRRQPKKNDS